MTYKQFSNIIKSVIVLLSLLPAMSARGEIVDRIVAIVNEDAVTLSELDKEGRNLFQKIASEAPANAMETSMQKAREEVLSSLIDKLLVEQRAAELSLSVADDEVDKAIDRILVKSGMSIQAFRNDLERNGTNETDYRAALRWQILQSKLISYEIRSKIVITDEKIKEHYNNNFTKKSGDGFHILQMGFLWSDSGVSHTAEEAKIRAEETRKMVLEGKSFKELAKSFSDLPSAADGGDIGVFTEKELDDAMRGIILALKPGEVSQVVEIPLKSGYQFLKLLSSKSGEIVEQAPYESVKDDIANLLHEEELTKQFNAWVTKIREESDIKKML